MHRLSTASAIPNHTARTAEDEIVTSLDRFHIQSPRKISDTSSRTAISRDSHGKIKSYVANKQFEKDHYASFMSRSMAKDETTNKSVVQNVGQGGEAQWRLYKDQLNATLDLPVKADSPLKIFDDNKNTYTRNLMHKLGARSSRESSDRSRGVPDKENHDPFESVKENPLDEASAVYNRLMDKIAIPKADSSDYTSDDSLEDDSMLYPEYARSPSITARRSTTFNQGLKLITPEDAGLVYDHKNGVWQDPSKIESEKTMESEKTLDSNDSKNDSMNKSVSFKLPNTSPIATPKIADKFKVLPLDDRSDNTMSLVDDLTSISDIDTSFRIHRGDLVRVLTEILPRKETWETHTAVDLSNQNLDSVVDLNKYLPHLLSLSLSGNGLNSAKGVPKTVMKLNLSNNQLGSFTNFDNLVHLEYLDVSNNSISSLRCFSKCLHLRDLDMANNAVSSLDVFESGLIALNLENNTLTELDFAETLLPNLEILKLNHNEGLRECVHLETLKKLRVLELDSTAILSLDNLPFSLRKLCLRNCTQLKTLDLRGTKLKVLRINASQLEALDFNSLTYLEELVITNGNFDDFFVNSQSSMYIGSLPYLMKLTLLNCGITQMPDIRSLFPSLRKLDVRSNKIQRNFVTLIDILPLNLVSLNLLHNPICSTDDENYKTFFTSLLRKLRYLDGQTL